MERGKEWTEVSEGRTNNVDGTDQEKLGSQKEKLDHLCLREERKFLNCPTLRKRCHLFCIVPKLMDTSDMEKWKTSDSFPYSILRNTFKSHLLILNGIFNLTQVAIETVLQYLFLRLQSEKCHLWKNTTPVIWHWGSLLMSHLCICPFRAAGREWWWFGSESKFCQILKSSEKSFDINKTLL